MSCQHPTFEVEAEVHRIEPDEATGMVAAMCDLRVHCTECGEPFGWRGVQSGTSFDVPMRSIDALELRAPLLTPAELTLKGAFAGITADPPSGEPSARLGLREG